MIILEKRMMKMTVQMKAMVVFKRLKMKALTPLMRRTMTDQKSARGVNLHLILENE